MPITLTGGVTHKSERFFTYIPRVRNRIVFAGIVSPEAIPNTGSLPAN